LHVPSSFLYLLKQPSLWPLSVLPAVATVLLVGAGLVVGYWLGPALSASLVEGESVWVALTAIGIQIATVLGGGVAGLGIAIVLTAPIQELLSQKVERQLRGVLAESGRGIRWEIAQALRGALYFLVRAPLVVMLGLVPLAGPPLALLWAAHSLAFQQTDATLARHGLDFGTRREWHRRHRYESIGFGFAGLVTLVIPVANLMIMPVLVVGATRLALARLP
jgi:uncharacterized protein involved in cysteine biosynthesis